MKVLTIIGTRPEIIRLSRIIPKLDEYAVHKVLHTGQNYDPRLGDIFFSDLGVRTPDRYLDCHSATFAGQNSKIFKGVESYIKEFKPDRALVLGDTNSGLSAIVCEKMGVPVFHMEAGNRCWDLKVPEELNRRIIDTVSTVNLPYTYGSRENLLKEGRPTERIHVTGNPILEVLEYYTPQIRDSNVLQELGLSSHKYILVTAHRAENVDSGPRLRSIFSALNTLSEVMPVVFSCHPRTAAKIEKYGVGVAPGVKICPPFGFFDFAKLELECALGITDSGTVQEELCLLGRPAITIRDSTERPETVACGSNILAGLDADRITSLAQSTLGRELWWEAPEEYRKRGVSDTVVNILLGKI